MSCDRDPAELETYLLGRAGDRAAEIESHLESCPRCRDELDWLRLERQVVDSRTPPGRDDAAALWDGIAAQLDAAAPAAPAPRVTVRQRAAWFGSGFAAAAMAAAVMLLYVKAPTVTNPRPSADRPDAAIAVTPPAPVDSKDPLVALDRAEAEYTEAIDTLEAEYRAHRDRVTPATEHALAESRLLLGEARREAGDNIDARMKVLEAYASHLHTMQQVVTAIETE